LLDDLEDIKKDITKPDLSYLLNVIKNHSKKENITLNAVHKIITTNNLDYIILEEVKLYLDIASLAAKTLNFKLFQNDLKRITAGITSYKRRNNAK